MEANELIKVIKKLGVSQTSIAKSIGANRSSFNLALSGNRTDARSLEILVKTEEYITKTFKL